VSTKVHDLANQAPPVTASAPAAQTATVTGTGQDMINNDGRCYGIQQVGAVSGTTPTLDGKFQEGDTLGGAYSDIPGATFTQVTASTNLQTITFDRTKRFVRYVGTIAGTTPSFTFGVLIGEQKKQL
jgi:hypothetical protein